MTKEQRLILRAQAEAIEHALQFVFENPGKSAYVESMCLDPTRKPDILYIPAVPKGIQ